MHQQLIKDLSDDEINAFIKISDKLINNIKRRFINIHKFGNE